MNCLIVFCWKSWSVTVKACIIKIKFYYTIWRIYIIIKISFSFQSRISLYCNSEVFWLAKFWRIIPLIDTFAIYIWIWLYSFWLNLIDSFDLLYLSLNNDFLREYRRFFKFWFVSYSLKRKWRTWIMLNYWY